jgi:tRNA (guanine-N7-)-methyltransferase
MAAPGFKAPDMTDENLPQGVPLRLYGRRRGHPLRPRQEKLLAETLPRLRLSVQDIATLPRPLWLEVGFGGGEHTLAQVAAHRNVTLIASEVFENGLCSLLSALVPEGGEATAPLPPNLRLWPEDARPLLAALPDRALERLFLMFPDPWPKSRHAKRRFVHPAMLPVVARVLAPGGIWRVASDDPTYQGWLRETFAGQGLFVPHSYAQTRPEGWPPTRYEAKALREGRQPMYWEWRRA